MTDKKEKKMMQRWEKVFFTSLMMIMSVMVDAGFKGDGTFYGAGGHGALGACMLDPGFNGIGATVAINRDQWDGGLSCGKCVRIQPSSLGIGMTPLLDEIVATIDNLCPECIFGDIDIGMAGDGRWQIEWDFVPCHT